jgi:uncharacterized SAM-binding protein YcdF (DUF218 family)
MDLLIKILLAPIVQLLLVSLLTTYLLWRRRQLSRRLLALPLVFFLLITCRPLADWLAAPLEFAYPAFQQQQVKHIAVLGCGHVEASFLPLSSQPEPCTLARLIEAAQIWQAQPTALIHLSGSIADRRIPHTELEKQFLVALGIPADVIRQHTAATNTEGEVTLLVNAIPANEPMALVTNAMHMPRAMRWFALKQRTPIAAPTDYRIRRAYADSNWPVWIPQLNATITLGEAYYEYAGLLEQWVIISMRPANQQDAG